MEIRNYLLLALIIILAVQMLRADEYVSVTRKMVCGDFSLLASCERLKYENGQLFFFRCSRQVRSTSYEVRNALGQLLAAGKMTSSTLVIGELEAGMYYVSLQEQSGRMKMLRMVVED